MKLVVGLGNPGEKYKNTRHNVGFLVVDALCSGPSTDSSPSRSGLKGVPSRTDLLYSQWKVSKSTGALICWPSDEVELVKPQKYMNKSGVTVKGVFKKHPNKFEVTNLENLWVVHDDLDIALGEHKVSFGKGPKTHNGLNNIYEQIGTKDFWHVRVGVAPVFTGQGRLKNSTNDIHHSIIGRRRETTGADYVLGKWRPEEREIIDKVISKIVIEFKDVLA